MDESPGDSEHVRAPLLAEPGSACFGPGGMASATSYRRDRALSGVWPRTGSLVSTRDSTRSAALHQIPTATQGTNVSHSFAVVLRSAYGIDLKTSNVDSSGGVAKPPSIPCCMRGIKMSSRKRSQLSCDSWMATIVHPSADGPAAWKICPFGNVSGVGWTAAIDASYCSLVPPGK